MMTFVSQMSSNERTKIENLLGNPEVEDAFSDSHEDLENAAEQLYSSPSCPQLLRFEALSLKTPQTVPPTPGTALQNKIQNKIKQSLGSQLNIQLQQQMGVFQASIMESLQSLRDKIKSVKKTNSEAGVDQISAADLKPGLSKQPYDLPISPNTQSNT